jgi:hypothetical protein
MAGPSGFRALLQTGRAVAARRAVTLWMRKMTVSPHRITERDGGGVGVDATRSVRPIRIACLAALREADCEEMGGVSRPSPGLEIPGVTARQEVHGARRRDDRDQRSPRDDEGRHPPARERADESGLDNEHRDPMSPTPCVHSPPPRTTAVATCRREPPQMKPPRPAQSQACSGRELRIEGGGYAWARGVSMPSREKGPAPPAERRAVTRGGG